MSVVVLSYNNARYIEQTLDSIAAQTRDDFELVVADDASTDASLGVLHRWIDTHNTPCLLLANERNLGITPTLNRVLPRLRGRYVVIFASDDWMELDRLERQVRYLDGAPPDVAMVMGDLRRVDERGADLGSLEPAEDLRRMPDQFTALVRQNFVLAPTVMIRRRLYDEVGAYDESLPFEDYDLWLRVAERYRIGYLPGIVASQRMHRASATATFQAGIVEGKIRCLVRHLGSDPQRDSAIWHQVGRYALHLHKAGYDPATVRAHLRAAVRHRPTRPLVRAVLESHLRLGAGSLSLRHVPPRGGTVRVQR